MPRLHASFILAYHGCSAEVGQRIVNGEPMDASDQAYDWLGPGIYFWKRIRGGRGNGPTARYLAATSNNHSWSERR